jgi:hypothetical protein
MLALVLPASVSELHSQGIAAVQSGSVVVAVARLEPATLHGWRVTLAAGHAGGHCRPVARLVVAGRTRSLAVRAATAVAERYARALAAGDIPPPLPPAAPLAAEPRAAYRLAAPSASALERIAPECLEHVEVQCLASGGFLLTLTGAGYDGTCEHVAPAETALWQVVEELSALCHSRPRSVEARAATGALECHLHARLLALLQARAAHRLAA